MDLRVPVSPNLPLIRAPTPNPHRNSFSLLPLPKRLTKSQLHSTNPSSKCSTKPPYLARSFLFSPTPNPNVAQTNGSVHSIMVHAQVEEEVATFDHTLQRLVMFLDASWKFLRPYTIRGSIVASISWAMRAFLEKPNGLPLGISLLQALSAVLVLICANAFVTGLNQIYDIDIDKINKPHLPIPAGELSVNAAWTLVLSMTAGGLAIALANRAQPVTIALYGCAVLLGYLYSVPPFRWKAHALGTYIVMAGLRGVLVNFGLYFALKATLGFPFQWKAPMTFIATFTSLLSVVFGLIKDLPDIEGDRKHNIVTPAAILGPRNTTLLGAGVVLSIYIATMISSIFMPQSLRSSVMLPAHIILSMSLGFQVWLLEKADYGQEACQNFYMALWYLCYAEYVLFPFI